MLVTELLPWLLLLGDKELSRSILKKVESLQEGKVLPRLHRIAAERQMGDLKQAEALYRDAVETTEDLETKLFFLKKFATFAAKVCVCVWVCVCACMRACVQTSYGTPSVCQLHGTYMLCRCLLLSF